jgi:hypothetical protein
VPSNSSGAATGNSIRRSHLAVADTCQPARLERVAAHPNFLATGSNLLARPAKTELTRSPLLDDHPIAAGPASITTSNAPAVSGGPKAIYTSRTR